ncbi:peptide ABC transporter substrate-binding protein [Moritella marina ATCC 15381]|uniref:Peptide ABC transporter substrate-binding protein n=1 Tax=Moritella marina ATCC 15381 TaxID=1202962 RepID=A0A5J6WKX5_MORMI|nr:SgrR family transcriptional regulator [Moritella marina]QFI38084.1 peptide ABC transporter substrate-binding protein [Moritella marina ATCC 15381]
MANLKRKLEIYEQIFQHFGPGVSACQISQIANLLHVTERHVQTLLKKLVNAGWIKWQASSGRSKKAILTCQVEPIEACYELAKSIADEGNLDQLLNILSFGGRDAGREFQSYLNDCSNSDRRVAYLPFHRELEALKPHKVRRRTERFLITQICQCLTAVEQGNLVGDLAYHWFPNDNATTWHFQIRRGVRFHDSSILNAQDIVNCLNRLIQSEYWHSTYQHIIAVNCFSDDQLEIKLNQTDWHLPRLLARVESSIFKMTSTATKLMGTGAFSLAVFSSKMLRLSRNTYYTREHAILDWVELWVYPQWAKSKACAQNQICVQVPDNTVTSPSDKCASFLMIQNPNESVTKRHITVEDTAECKELFNSVSTEYDQGISVSYGDYSKSEQVTICSIIEENDPFSAWLVFLLQYPFSNHQLNTGILNFLGSSITSIRHERDFNKATDSLAALLSWLGEENVVKELKNEPFLLELSEKINGAEVNGYGWCELKRLWFLLD